MRARAFIFKRINVFSSKVTGRRGHRRRQHHSSFVVVEAGVSLAIDVGSCTRIISIAFSATELIAIHQASESVRYPTTPVDRVERRRWKIERLFAWLRNFRRLVVRYERYAENFLGILYLGCCVILLRHI